LGEGKHKLKKKAEQNELTKEERSFGRYIILGIFLILVFLSYQIIEPYILVLVTSFILGWCILFVRARSRF
jgi:hypothetical protein